MKNESTAESIAESMTGFGEARAKLNSLTFICRLRSLNHRFLDLKLRLPRNDMLSLDTAIRQELAAHFKRGSIEISLNVDTSREAGGATINVDTAKAYWKSAQQLAKALKVTAGSSKVTLDAILRLPGVIGTGVTEDLLADVNEATLMAKVVRPAIESLKQNRREEGRKIAAHIFEMLNQMDQHVSQIVALEEPEKEKARQTIIDRAGETVKLLGSISGGELSPEFTSRLREEAVFWIERRDFAEERVRLQLHLKNFRALLTGTKEPPSGKKLEFIQQEILREINTLGTKAHSPTITTHTVELKAILERIREQVANVE